jgi:hypothetical protein
MLWSEHERSALEGVDSFDYLASVDTPDQLDFFSQQIPSGYHM